MGLLIMGLVIVLSAIGLLSYALVASPVPRVEKARRTLSVAGEPTSSHLGHAFVDGVDRLLRGRSWAPFSAPELELAGVRTPVGVLTTWLLAGAAAAAAVGSLLLRSPVTGVLLALAVPVAAKVVLRVKTSRRRAAFADQMDPTLRIIASALRAGQSLSIALASVGQDAEAPMSEELARITNEARVGRDMVTALHESADRMDNEDLRWFAEAVEVQRDTGGNLNDIIDIVAETIRERAEIRGKIRANASEGKASAWVLMALPIALGVIYSLLRPGYLVPLFTSTGGQVATVLSAILYVVAYFWMRAIVNFKI